MPDLHVAVLTILLTWGAIAIVYSGIESLCCLYVSKWDSFTDEHEDVQQAQYIGKHK